MEEGFFRKATSQEHEAVVRNEKKRISINLVVSRKHRDKIKHGDYAVQIVMALGRDSSGKGKQITKVTFISENGMLYIADILNSYIKNMKDKDIGLLVMINEDEKDNPVDDYRFIPVSEYNPEYRQKAGAFSLKGTKPVFDPRKNKLDPRNNNPKRKVESESVSESEMGNRDCTFHEDSDTVIDHRLNKISDRNEKDDSDTF